MVKNSASRARPSKKSKKKKVSLTHGGKTRSGGAHGGKARSGEAHGGEAPSAHGGEAHKNPWAGDMVAVEWDHEGASQRKAYTGSVVLTTETHFDVSYDQDSTTHSHPILGTRWRYDFSAEKNCLKAVRAWAKGNRVPVRKDELTRMGTTYRRLARCRSKEQMFKGWRKVVNAFWAAYSNSVVIPRVDA